MKKTLNLVDEIIEQTLSEREWNKNSKTPRDYSKEYNKPGSKEQEERNKRKRDKRRSEERRVGKGRRDCDKNYKKIITRNGNGRNKKRNIS